MLSPTRRLYLPSLSASEGRRVAAKASHRALVIASNRLPVRFTVTGNRFELAPAAGGLAAALRAVRGDAVWIGWPGTVVPHVLEPEVTSRLSEDNLVPVFLTAEEE